MSTVSLPCSNPFLTPIPHILCCAPQAAAKASKGKGAAVAAAAGAAAAGANPGPVLGPEQFEALVHKLEMAHFDALKARSEEWQPDVKVWTVICL